MRTALAVAEQPALSSRPVNVGIVVASVSRTGGGVFECLRGLTRHLRGETSAAVSVFGLADRHSAEDRASWRGVPVSAHPILGPRALGYSPGLDAALRRAALDLVHVHGLWMYVSLAARRWAGATGRPFLVSPHGHLDGWALANSGWKKKAAYALYEGETLRRADCIHALSHAERDSIRALGLRNPICVIPNGVEPATRVAQPPPDWRTVLPADAKILLYLGRISPQKGLAALIQAFARVLDGGAGHAPAWRLIIAGWDQGGHAAELKRLTGALGLDHSVLFVGARHGAQKDATLAAADAFVLPSVSEGLPMAVLEAWSHALPVLMTPQCNLPEGFRQGAALAATPHPEGLARGLAELFAMSDFNRRAMGINGLRLTRDRFAWDLVAQDLNGVYRWLVNGGEPPACVTVA